MKNQTQQPTVPAKAKTSSHGTSAHKALRKKEAPTNFSGHIGELRRRLFWIALVFVAASAAAYSYNEELLRVVLAPLHGEKLTYLTPAGGFSFIFQISMYTGLFAAIPLFVYHLHAFIKPALPERARKSAAKVVLAASLLVIGGISYGYFIAIPAALEFLTTFASESVLPSLTADSYLSFFLAYVAGIAALSLLPLLLMFLHWVKPQTPRGLLKSERWVVAGAFVVAAVITPTPDAVNQAMIALPIILIYQLGVVGVLISIRQEKKAATRAKAAATSAIFRTASAHQHQPAAARAIIQAPAGPIIKGHNLGLVGKLPVATATAAASLRQQQPPAGYAPVRRSLGIDGLSHPTGARPLQTRRPLTAPAPATVRPRPRQQSAFNNALRSIQQPARQRLSMDGFVQ